MYPYFNQSQQWAEFYKQANDEHHDIIEFKCLGQIIYVYQYPFTKSKKFWYLPRLNITVDSVNSQNIVDLFNDIKDKAKKLGIVFIGMDIDERLSSVLEDMPQEDSVHKISNWLSSPLNKAHKQLQYPATPILPTTQLEGTSQQNIADFYSTNEKGLFARANQACRRHTRRSMDKGWSYELTQDDNTFEDFWNIWVATAKRQGFNLHPKSYIKTLLSFPWAKLLVIRDSAGEVQGGWFELHIGNSFINIYGANTQKSLDDYGQYFSHVAALQCIKQLQEEGHAIETYDMGGSDDAGYGLFKKSYRPDYLRFLGQYDMVLNPLVYHSYFLARRFKRFVSNLR
jgi:lipid II:glycine glycyltransferase (peptidoglycan interpeptide bridge formation enzyme)